MSYIVGDLIDAVNVQANLDEYFENTPNPPMMQKVPFLQFMMDPMNRGNLQQGMMIGKGQVRKVEVIYDQELAHDKVVSNVDNPSCANATYTPPEHSQEYDFDTGVNRSDDFTFTRADLERAVTSPLEYFNKNLLKTIANVEVAVNAKEASALSTMYGAWSTDATDWATANPDVSISANVLNFKTRKDGSVDPFPYTAREIQEALEYCGYMAPPVIFSGSTLRSWVLDGRTFTATDIGIDLQRAVQEFGFGAIFDTHVASALGGADYAIALQPGAVQMLYFTASGWDEGMPGVIQGSDYYKTTILSPRTNLPMDLIIKDDCGTITVRVIATTKLVQMPEDMFNASNRYSAVKFVNKIRVVNA